MFHPGSSVGCDPLPKPAPPPSQSLGGRTLQASGGPRAPPKYRTVCCEGVGSGAPSRSYSVSLPLLVCFRPIQEGPRLSFSCTRGGVVGPGSSTPPSSGRKLTGVCNVSKPHCGAQSPLRWPLFGGLSAQGLDEPDRAGMSELGGPQRACSPPPHAQIRRVPVDSGQS